MTSAPDRLAAMDGDRVRSDPIDPCPERAEEMGQIGIKLNLTVVQGSVLWAASTDGGIEQSGNFDMDIWDAFDRNDRS